MHNSLSIDEIIEGTIEVCKRFESESLFVKEKQQLKSLKSRLYRGEIHIAVIGQFNRGKSTFINKLLQCELLPASVLPLTSLSTQLIYREKTGYTLTFQDGSTLDEEATEEQIQQVLIDYVAESSNPKNHKGVCNVKVGCPNELLNHGTRIIDTPGFGSTHIHNTKATIELLKECDAVLFMLSADLPITQIELNFLKRIQPHVTRLFFIYNKKDLLSVEELQETTHFIQETLRNQLQIESRDIFFTISAREADEDRTTAGITAIEENILGFLQREKYFSLAEAIHRKLKDTQSQIVATLNENIVKTEEQQLIHHEALECVEEKLSTLLSAIEKSSTELSEASTLIEEQLFSSPYFAAASLESDFTSFFDDLLDEGKIKSFNELIPQLQNSLILHLISRSQKLAQQYQEEIRATLHSIIERHNLHYRAELHIQIIPETMPQFFEKQREGLHLFQSSSKRATNIRNHFESVLPIAMEAYVDHMKCLIAVAIKNLCEDLELTLTKNVKSEEEKITADLVEKKSLTNYGKTHIEAYKIALNELPRV